MISSLVLVLARPGDRLPRSSRTQVSLDSQVLTEQFYFWTVVIMWLIHAGFMAYEAGAARRKNVMSTAMKNILTIAVVTPSFYYFGWYIYGCFEEGWPKDGHAQPDVEGLEASAGSAEHRSVGGADGPEPRRITSAPSSSSPSSSSRGRRRRSCRERSSSGSASRRT